MRKIIIISLVTAAALSGCCAHQQPPKTKSAMTRRVRSRSGYRVSDSSPVRISDQVHVYRVGRLRDGESMREAGNYYHVEQSAYWNRCSPSGRQVLINQAPVTSGPSQTASGKAYRVVPDERELTELRNEAKADKDQTAAQLAKAKLAREKLEGLTEGLAHTDEVIKQAETEITRLKEENGELRHKAEMKESGKPGIDFSQIEGASKQPKTDGLQPGPGADD